MMTLDEFAKKFWAVRDWVQNGTYPDWPYAVYQFITEKGLKRIIEVGSGTGAVTYAIALTKPEGLICIDDERENNLLGEVGDLILRAGCGIAGLHRGKSEDVLPTLVGRYDLLVHDGEHSFQSVTYDCGEALRLGCKYVIVHDSNWPEVDEAIRKLHWPEWTLLSHSGHPRVLCNPLLFTPPVG